MKKIEISFIIPALNEEMNIGATIRSVQQAVFPLNKSFEVILVDNGSSDQTREIAASLGARVLIQHGGTIASLRNLGAAHASGTILIFLDADVTLTDTWSENFDATYQLLLNHNSKLITGSHCTPPESNNYLLKYWFASLATDPRNTHLGSAHLILRKSSFEEVGGFDARLKTGEDFELCERATRHGYKIINNPLLKVTHHDFPDTLHKFIKREVWHGMGDVDSVRTAIKSKVVCGSILFFSAHLAILLGTLLHNATLGLAGIFILALLLSLSSVIKNKHAGIRKIIANTGIFYFYYWGRTFSIIKKLTANLSSLHS
jgi:glycosyltransferase involved in cell wall biosynthesis